MPPVINVVAAVVLSLGQATTLWAVTNAMLVRFAIVVAATAYSRAQAKKMKRAMAAAGALDTSRKLNLTATAESWKLVVGEVRIGGNLVYAEQTGTNKEYTHIILVHASCECDSFQKRYLNGEEITIDGSGVVTSPSKWAGKVTVKEHLGSESQTVDTDLQAAVGSSVWTNNHRLRGHCYTYLKFKTDSDSFAAGLPTYTVDLRGAKCYDPRTATTAWTRNAALVTRWYLALARDRGGVGASADELPDAYFNAAANICDESVALNPSGTEARYTVNGVIDTAVAPGENIVGLVAAQAGVLPYVNGQFCLRAGAHSSAVMDLTEDDLAGPITLDTRDGARAAFNGVKGVYLSPLNNWEPSDFPPVKNDTYMAEDGGERIWEDVALNFTTSSATAQRLAKIMLERSRQDFTFTAPFKLKALNLVPGDVVTLTLARYGFSAKLFEVQSCALAPQGGGDGPPALTVPLALRETASGVWDWSSGEETTVDLAANSTLVTRDEVPNPSGFAAANATLAERTSLPRVKLTWTVPASVVVTVGGYTAIEYKLTADSDWTQWGRVRGDLGFDYVTDLRVGTSTDFRIKHVNRFGRESAWSATQTVTPNSGDGTYTALLTNEAHSISCDSAGTPVAGEIGVGGRAASDVLAFGGTSALTAVASAPGVGQFAISVATLSGTATFTKVDNDTVRVDAITTDSAVGRVTIDLEGLLTVTKDFTVTKVNSGNDGDPGTNGADAQVLYALSDAAAVRKATTGAYTPSVVNFTAWSKLGTAAPAAYSGRFIIATYDGATWTDQYTSAANESSKAYTVPASIVALRVRLYLAGGTTTQVDEQIVPVAFDGNNGTNGTNGSNAPLVAVLSELDVAGSGANGASVATPSVTCIASGGTPPYTYAWTRVSGSYIGANSSTSATTKFSSTTPNDSITDETFKCTVTDSVSATADSPTVTASITHGTPP